MTKKRDLAVALLQILLHELARRVQRLLLHIDVNNSFLTCLTSSSILTPARSAFPSCFWRSPVPAQIAKTHESIRHHGIVASEIARLSREVTNAQQGSTVAP